MSLAQDSHLVPSASQRGLCGRRAGHFLLSDCHMLVAESFTMIVGTCERVKARAGGIAPPACVFAPIVAAGAVFCPLREWRRKRLR